MPRNPTMSQFSLQMEPELRRAVKAFKRAHELDTDAQTLRYLVRWAIANHPAVGLVEDLLTTTPAPQ